MKKSMKKRSLMSAVAMLVVSAIVLSSATYAWFSLGTTARVSQLNFSVESANGISVSANGTKYYSVLTNEILRDDGGHDYITSPLILSPVDYNPASAGNFRLSSGIVDDVITMSASPAEADTDYVEFQVYIKSTTSGTVSFAGSAIGGSAGDVIYVSIADDEGEYIFPGSGSSTYQPLKTSTTTATLTNGIAQNLADIDGLVQIGDGTAAFDTIGEYSLDLVAGVAKMITVRLWVEGQDPQCAGAYAGGTASVALNLAFTETATTAP